MNKTKHNTDSISSSTQPKPLLKLGIDAHASQFVIATQVDGSAAKPPQRLDHSGLLNWVKKKLEEGFALASCYEAGPFGFVLHRELLALGVTNYVIHPRNWDDQNKGVKTDRSDARALLGALDRFLAGNPHALTVVRVPTVEQERRRSESRIRESLQRQLKAVAQRGRGVALHYGYRLTGPWYGPRRWPSLVLPNWLRHLLEPLRQSALFLAQQLQKQTKAVEENSRVARPVGLGALTEQIMEREVGDWNRFKNRRQISSYLGLCPREHSSGASRRQDGISKAGNGRLRLGLCQLAWRLWLRQPDYWLVKKWRDKFRAPNATSRQRRQITMALARGFAVDWWRLRTGQTTPQKLGLLMAG